MAENETQQAADKQNEAEQKAEVEEIPPVESQHQVVIGGKTLEYTVHTGLMPLKNDESGDIEANIFFMAYTLNGIDDVSKRPLVFVFNGGPGSSSVWLHLGAVGPMRVKMQDAGWMPAPPYQLETNEHTWLDRADLVFIDPVGTGYSRAIKAEDNEKYWHVEGDIESVGKFIRMYLTRYKRWASPLFLAGESYGTFRSAGLAGHLIDKGIAFNGIMLISTVLNLQNLLFERGNDLPYILYVPTYAATAWYHKKLPEDLQSKALPDLLKEVEEWAESVYSVALMKGDRLSAEAQESIAERLARYTGLDKEYIKRSKLRLQIMRFCRELRRDENSTVGRLDSRFKGINDLAVNEFPEFDPSMAAIMPPYTAMFNQYVRSKLNYETDTEYQILSFKVNQNWKGDNGKFYDTSEALRSALAKNPFLKVFIGQGYYDLATPHFAAQYTFDHMGIDDEVRDNLQTAYYEAGHMFYLDVEELSKLKDDIVKFIAFSVTG